MKYLLILLLLSCSTKEEYSKLGSRITYSVQSMQCMSTVQYLDEEGMLWTEHPNTNKWTKDLYTTERDQRFHVKGTAGCRGLVSGSLLFNSQVLKTVNDKDSLILEVLIP